jgi:excisionase family DNA binding protein
MNGPEWMTVSEVAEVLRCHPDTVRERIRDRSRRDAIPAELVSGSGHALRVHRSVAFPREQVVAVISDEQIARVVRQTFLQMGLLVERRQIA